MQLKIQIGAAQASMETRGNVQDTKAALKVIEGAAKTEVEKEKVILKKDIELIKEKVKTGESSTTKTSTKSDSK